MLKHLSKFGSVYFGIKPVLGFFRFVFFGFGGLLLVAFLFSSVWVYGKYTSLGSIKEKVTTPPQGSVVYDRNNVEMFKFYDADQKREIVSLDQIPEVMQLAVIALEDENFYYNEDGIPWKNLAGSLVNCAKGQGCRGGSGLSQQLIKNVTNQKDATFDRKANELLAAYKFNQEVSKQEVLGLYLNWVPFGRNTYGIESAVKSYYGRGIEDKDDKGNYKLTAPEACFIAAVLPKPESFAIAIKEKIDGKESETYTELVTRKNACLDKMSQRELRGKGTDFFIAPSKVEELKKEEVKFKAYQNEEIKFGHIKNYLTEELKKLDISEKDLFSKGLRIKTTFDLKLQEKVEQSIADGIKNYIKPNQGNNAAAVVLDGPTGQIVAMVGSADFNNKEIQGEVNVATSPRQPGSSIKPYVFASAFNNGFNPATIFIDTATDFGLYKPLNFDKNFYGPVSARFALQNSLNIPAVKALYLSANPGSQPDGEGGLTNFFDFTEKTGLKFPLKDKGMCGVSTAIGGCEVTAMSHAAGINTILQEGKLLSPTPFLEIISSEKNNVSGTVDSTQDLYNLAVNSPTNPFPKKDNAIDPLIAKQTARLMADSASRTQAIWGRTAQFLILDDWTGENAVAAKTGTTNDVKDMWVVGGSPYYTVVTWAGNTDATPMNIKASSSGVVGPIWKDIMKYLHKDKPKAGFSKEGLIPTGIESGTGLLGAGITELLTPAQIEKLKAAGKDDYRKGIFFNRTPVVRKTVKVNKLDKLLADPADTKIPANLIVDLSCTAAVSEFPLASNWTTNAFGTCPSRKSELDVDKAKSTLETNFASDGVVTGYLAVKVKPPVEDLEIKEIQIVVGGQTLAAASGTKELKLPIAGLSGKKDVQILVKNVLDNVESFVYSNVDFGNSSSVDVVTSSNPTTIILPANPTITSLPTPVTTSQPSNVVQIR